MNSQTFALALLASLALGCNAETNGGAPVDSGAAADVGDSAVPGDAGDVGDVGDVRDAGAEDTGAPQDAATPDADADGADAVSDTSQADTEDALGPIDAGDTTEPTDTAAPDDATDGGLACEGETPLCAPSCGGDSFYGEATCEGGVWTCAEGIPTTDCPPGSCWGEKYPGEICTDQGWACAPDADAYAACHDVMCLTCAGWTDPPEPTDGCACVCEGDAVLCTKVGAGSCSAASETTLPGVTIAIAEQDCVFTLAEAAAGIAIPYTITIASPVEGAVALPQDGGQCDQPGPSGLITFEKLEGNDQTWCICDSGLCQGPDETPKTLPAGTWTQTFQWDGKNFFGPSDTGFEPGDPFPPGDYTLTISAKGKVVTVDSMTPFETKATATIHIVP